MTMTDDRDLDPELVDNARRVVAHQMARFRAEAGLPASAANTPDVVDAELVYDDPDDRVPAARPAPGAMAVPALTVAAPLPATYLPATTTTPPATTAETAPYRAAVATLEGYIGRQNALKVAQAPGCDLGAEYQRRVTAATACAQALERHVPALVEADRALAQVRRQLASANRALDRVASRTRLAAGGLVLGIGLALLAGLVWAWWPLILASVLLLGWSVAGLVRLSRSRSEAYSQAEQADALMASWNRRRRELIPDHAEIADLRSPA